MQHEFERLTGMKEMVSLSRGVGFQDEGCPGQAMGLLAGRQVSQSVNELCVLCVHVCLVYGCM